MDGGFEFFFPSQKFELLSLLDEKIFPCFVDF